MVILQLFVILHSFVTIIASILVYVVLVVNVKMTSSVPLTDTFAFLNQSNEFVTDADIVVDVADHLKVKKNITYIVCGVIFRKINEACEVLMMQETRPDCNGAWYLPAGRLESNETLEEGMKREVLEETGILCNSEGMIAVETSQFSSWFRFTFLASELGGRLKTVPDEESLGAAWYPVETILNKRIHLRGSDILKLIKLGVERFEDQNIKLAVSLDRPFTKLLCRFCVVNTSDDGCTFILVKNVNGRFKLPVVEFSQRISFAACAHKISELFNAPVKVLSTISVESYPKPAYQHDGFCLSLLCEMSSVACESNLSEGFKNDGYYFVKCDDVHILDNIRTWSLSGCKFFNL